MECERKRVNWVVNFREQLSAPSIVFVWNHIILLKKWRKLWRKFGNVKSFCWISFFIRFSYEKSISLPIVWHILCNFLNIHGWTATADTDIYFITLFAALFAETARTLQKTLPANSIFFTQNREFNWIQMIFSRIPFIKEHFIQIWSKSKLNGLMKE